MGCRSSARIITATTAGSGFFPLDRQLKVEGQRWSEALRKLAVWLSGLVTFEQAEGVLEQVGQVPLSDSTAWRQVQTCGAQVQALEAAQCAATAVPDRQQIMPGEVPTPNDWPPPCMGPRSIYSAKAGKS